jgi:hypothetical protein
MKNIDEAFRQHLQDNINQLRWWQKLPILRNYYLMWCYIEAFEYTISDVDDQILIN